MSDKIFTVFYSWQSDLDDSSNRRIIRDAIRDASSRLEELYESDNLLVNPDEATRNRSGSPNIPLTILEKIRSADAFVCDITTINQGAPDGQRRVPNPNVMFELGYAVSILGWERIIMLFNTEYGDFSKDAPFDIDRHRASFYHLPSSSKGKTSAKKVNKTYKQSLFDLVFVALQAIYDNNPPRPKELEDISPEEKKRNHDVFTLSDILQTIHIPTLDFHINDAPKMIYQDIFHFWSFFDGAMSSSLFHLYDPKLSTYVTALHQHWGDSLSYGHYYHSSPPNHQVYQFSGSHYGPPTPEDEKALKEIEESIQNLRFSLNRLLDYIREEYVEINIEALNSVAWESYQKFMRDKLAERSFIEQQVKEGEEDS